MLFSKKLPNSKDTSDSINKHELNPLKKLFSCYSKALLSLLIDIGVETGLWKEAAKGSFTSSELAANSKLDERYVREWLSAMTCARIFKYDAVTKKFTLVPGYAAILAGPQSETFTAWAATIPGFAKHKDKYVHVFKNGGGLSPNDFENFHSIIAQANNSVYDTHLIKNYLPKTGNIYENLEKGESLRVLEIGCGSGHALNILAKRYPLSQFFGYDLSSESIAVAQREARELLNWNVNFQRMDVTNLDANSIDKKFHLIMAFDVIHDLPDPQKVLNTLVKILDPTGVFMMVDVKASSNLEDNLHNPMGVWMYSLSTLHCLTQSLGQGGVGLGSMWGQQKAKSMLKKAGFSHIEYSPAADKVNAIYICRNISKSKL